MSQIWTSRGRQFLAAVVVVQAFMIGSNTSLPALASFSIYAAIGLLFDLILQVRIGLNQHSAEFCSMTATVTYPAYTTLHVCIPSDTVLATCYTLTGDTMHM